MTHGKAQHSYTRYPAAVVLIALALSFPLWPSHAQTKKPAPPPPKPTPQNNPFGQLGEQLKQKTAETTIGTLLNNNLPLKLDANAAYSTVAAPPGGPFMPQPLTLAASDFDRPLPPGDYTVNMLAFCTEYSVHRPGAGVAYRLGPLQGKAAGAIGDLLWRGTLQKNLPPQQLQAVSWAIQSGLRYDQMPKTYQSVIDGVIPDHRTELSGDFIQSIEDNYNNLAKGTKLPPLQQMLGGMGKSGALALSADRQRQALLRQNTTDQIKEQTLFAGQESGVYTPVRAEEGPWTERIPGVAYLRYKIVGGNMARNNVMEIRILSRTGGGQTTNLFHHRAPGSLRQTPRSLDGGFLLRPASFSTAKPEPAPQTSTPPPTSPHALIGNSIGCAVGQGAQCLIPVPVPATTADCVAPCVGRVLTTRGQVQVMRGNTLITLNPGDQIKKNDRIITGPNSGADVRFPDGSDMVSLSEKTSVVMDDYVYDQREKPGVVTNWVQGAFAYVGSALGPSEATRQARYEREFNSFHGSWGKRGTEFVAAYDTAGQEEVDLIEGQLDITPKAVKQFTTFTGPVKIMLNDNSSVGTPLSRTQYEATKARLFPSQAATPRSAVPSPASNSPVL